MDDNERRAELADFLRSRRARMDAEQAGLPRRSRRRTPGLRREEVADLSDVGVSWYTQLEQGRDIHVSFPILKRIADALQLNSDERMHLYFLANQSAPVPEAPIVETVSPALQWVFNNLSDSPAFIRGRRWDVLAWNGVITALFGDICRLPAKHRNTLWKQFMDENSRRMNPNWEQHVKTSLAAFRIDYDRFVGDRPWFAELIDDLNNESPEFREWWPRHDVEQWRLPADRYIHPTVGELFLQRVSLQVDGSEGMRLVVFTPQPGTDSNRKLRQLARMAAARPGALAMSEAPANAML